VCHFKLEKKWYRKICAGIFLLDCSQVNVAAFSMTVWRRKMVMKNLRGPSTKRRSTRYNMIVVTEEQWLLELQHQSKQWVAMVVLWYLSERFHNPLVSTAEYASDDPPLDKVLPSWYASLSHDPVLHKFRLEPVIIYLVVYDWFVLVLSRLFMANAGL
jgi:hypothetical protein